MILFRIIVALLVLHLKISEATPCLPKDYVETITHCINGLQTLSNLKKPHINCVGEESIIIGNTPCTLKKASLSDRIIASAANLFSPYLPVHKYSQVDPMFGHLHAGQQINGVQVMYTNGEQLGEFAYFIREFIKVILSPISILMSLLMGKVVLAHDTIMGTDAYYVDEKILSQALEIMEMKLLKQSSTDFSYEPLSQKILNYIPYWNSSISSNVEQYFAITWYGFTICFIVSILVAQIYSSSKISDNTKFLIYAIIRRTLILAYFILCVRNLFDYSYKNAYWYYVLRHLDLPTTSDESLFRLRQLVTWFVLLRNEERFCDGAWLLVSIYCAYSISILWIRKTPVVELLVVVCKLSEVAYVLYSFITYSSNLPILLPLLMNPPNLYWSIAWIGRSFLPVGVSFWVCFACMLLEDNYRATHVRTKSDLLTYAYNNTETNDSNAGKVVGGHWLRASTNTTDFIYHPTKLKQNDDYNSDEDSSYEESQATYESSYDDSSLSIEEAD